MTTPLHLLAYALSPKYYSAEILAILGRVPPDRDVEVVNDYKRAFDKIFRDANVGVSVRREFGSFISERDLHHIAINDQSRMDAIRWWYLHGQDYIYLQPLAIKIPSQVASSSVAEQNWNTYSFIHSVKCNQLAAKKEDLVYIHNNLRLLSQKDPNYKKGPKKLWDVAPESADLVMTIQDLARATLADVDDDDDETIPSSASGTGLGSNDDFDQPLATTENPIDPDFFDNPFDD